jgi:hypothetical protein
MVETAGTGGGALAEATATPGHNKEATNERRMAPAEENLMEKMEAHVGKMEKQLRQWGAQLDELVAKAEGAGTEAKVDYRKCIDDLKAKHQVAQSKLDELKAAGSEKWETLKTGVESAWNELDVAFKKLKN